MKKGSKLKVLTLILTALLISLIGFLGIYQQRQTVVENILPQYLFNMDLKGARQVVFKVDDSTTQVTYDSEGNVVENPTEEAETETEETSEEQETETTTKDEPLNPPEILTLENYTKSKQILENRIKSTQISEYEVRLDNQTGKIYISLPENSDTDQVIQSIVGKGTFELTDSETNELLLSNNELKRCAAMYSSTETGVMVYIEFALNEEGTKKLEEISKTYIQSEDEEGNVIQKKATLKIDGSELTTTYFEEPITDGRLLLTIGSAATTGEEMQEYLKQAASIETLLGSGELPIEYTLEDVVFVKSDIPTYDLNILLYIAIGIFALMMVFLIIKYKKQGIVCVVSNIVFVATLLTVLRYTNVVISIDGILSIAFSVILNYILTILILKNVNEQGVVNIAYKKTMFKFMLACIPTAITAIVFTMAPWVALQSFGMVLFWAILLILICSFTFTKGLLNNIKINKQEEKQKEEKVNKTGSLIKVLLIIIAIVILIGIGMIVSQKFNIDLIYSNVKTIEINVPEGIQIQDVRNITNEVFTNQQVIIQPVEYFNDTVLIKTNEITDEQKTKLIEKINEKYKTEYTAETLIVNTVANLRLRDILKQYMIPLIITSITIIVYACIRYKKLGVLKTLLVTIATIIVPQATWVSLIAITRLPINRLTIPIALFIYALSVLLFGTISEKKINTISTNKKDK